MELEFNKHLNRLLLVIIYSKLKKEIVKLSQNAPIIEKKEVKLTNSTVDKKDIKSKGCC